MNAVRRKTVLVVENDNAFAESLQIQEYGWRVVSVASRKALAETAANNPEIDLVFLDLDGGGEEKGPAAAKRILEKRDLPIVFLARPEDAGLVGKTADLPHFCFAVKGSGALVIRFTLDTALELFEARKRLSGGEGGPSGAEPAETENDSARRRIEAALRESEEMFRSITEYSPDFISLTDKTGIITYVSPAARSVFGYEPEEMLGRPFLEFVDPPEVPRILNDFQGAIRTGRRVADLHVPMRRKDSSPLIGEVNGQLFECETRNGFLVVIRDITERKRSEEKIRTLLAEKELLLREVNHRIKNNMVTINSLLSLHAGNQKDPEAADALLDAAGRVRSIMVLYEILYQSEEFDRLSVKEYLNPLINAIMSGSPFGRRVKVETIMDDFTLDTSRLQSVGIIVNELLTNCIKYAFKGRDSGAITVIAALRDRNVVIGIEDDGVGVPASVNFGNSTGFGLTLVRMLSENLQGDIRLMRERGTRIHLEFKL